MLLRLALALALIVLALVVAAPHVVAPILRARLEEELAARMRARATIESLELSVRGHARLEGLEVEDEEGPILNIASVDAGVSLRELIAGRMRARADVQGFELIIRQRTDGTWNAEDWTEDEEPGAGGGTGSGEPSGPLPTLDVTLGGVVTLLGTNATARLEGLDVRAHSDPTGADMHAVLGRLSTPWLDADGDVTVTYVPEQPLRLTADLNANQGTLDLDASLDARAFEAERGAAATPASLELHAKGVRATSRLAPLIGTLHPALAALDATRGSELSGVLDSDLVLSYSGPLAGAEFAPSEVDGHGRFGITGARVTGTAALEEMLAFLGVAKDTEIEIRPVEFTLASGRVSYVGDWTWTIDDLETTFTGSMGLDRTLDLAWNVPITEEAVRAHQVLAVLAGRRVSLPIRGTVDEPEIDWRNALDGLLGELAPDELLEALDLDDVRSAGDLDELAEAIGALELGGEGDQSPKALLEEADRLWHERRRVEAAALYERLRDAHKSSLVYALNRDKIKERSRYREDG